MTRYSTAEDPSTTGTMAKRGMEDAGGGSMRTCLSRSAESFTIAASWQQTPVCTFDWSRANTPDSSTASGSGSCRNCSPGTRHGSHGLLRQTVAGLHARSDSLSGEPESHETPRDTTRYHEMPRDRDPEGLRHKLFESRPSLRPPAKLQA